MLLKQDFQVVAECCSRAAAEVRRYAPEGLAAELDNEIEDWTKRHRLPPCLQYLKYSRASAQPSLASSL
jgi:hypothetical protein